MSGFSLVVVPHLLTLLALALVSFGLGALVVALLFRRNGPGVQGSARFVFEAAVGLVALPNLLFAFALWRRLTVGWVAVLAAGAAVAAVFALAKRWRGERPDEGAGRREAAPAQRQVGECLVLTAGLIVAFLLTFTAALYPPYAFDSTLYHLPLARAFAEAGGLVWVEHVRVPVFAIHADLLFAAVGLFAPWGASHQVAVWSTILAAAALAYAARERAGPHAAALAAAVWVGTPLVLYLGAIAYVEAPLIVCLTLAAWALQRNRRDPRPAWAMVAMGALGTAAAIKYHGLFFLAVGGVFLVTDVASRQRIRDGELLRILAGAGIALALTLLPASMWLWSQTGNPLFPFYTDWFGANAWAGSDVISADRRVNGFDRVLLPWYLATGHARAGDLPPFSWVGLGLLAGALVSGWRLAGPWIALALIALYLGQFPILDARYTLLLLPPVLVGVAAWAAGQTVMATARRRRVLLAAALLPGLLWGGWHLYRLGWPPLDPAATHAFLARRFAIYPAIARLNELASEEDRAYVYRHEESKFHCRPLCFGERTGPASFQRWDRSSRDPAQHMAWLDSLRIDWIILPGAPETWIGSPWRQHAGLPPGSGVLFERGAGPLDARSVRAGRSRAN